jgi:uncharacterized membrane protein YphA (DoxX/SURF4 family)
MPSTSLFSRTAEYAPFVLRVALAAVVIWFGAQQLMEPDAWVSWVPAWADIFGMTQGTLIFINGSFEVVAGALLFAGVFTRAVAFFLFVHMAILVWEFGATPVGVRDFGLAMGLLTLALDDRRKWTLS